MSENSIQKCRTCLKSSAKVIPIAKHATACNPRRTYGQLLKEYAKLECNAEYELLMPQFLCVSCCRDLRNTYTFIRQAQYCNNNLINVISKQLDCLQERTIDLPENEEDLEKHLGIKLERTSVDCQTEQLEENIKIDANIQFKKSNDNEDNGGLKIIDNKQYNLNNLLNSSTPDDNTKTNTNDSITDTACPICRKKLSGVDNLFNHMRTQHDIENPSKIFHKQKIKENEVFSCKFCSSKYTNKNNYLYHLKHKHSIDAENGKERQAVKIIKCRSCDYTARTHAALHYHTRSKHGTEKDKFKCEFCSHVCLKKFDLFRHVKNAHKELIKTLKAENKVEPLSTNTSLTSPKLELDKSLKEDEDSSTDDDTPLIQTINRSVSTSNSSIEMEEDKEQFSDEEFIRNILNIKKRRTKKSTRSLARRCDECGNVYKDYNSLYAHQRHVHISEDKYSLCPHCGKKYKRKADLRIHIDKAHVSKNATEIVKQPAKVREKRFMCTECSYVCATITILNIHINRHHTGEKPYKCDICFKSFIVPYDLKIHRYLHTGERPYKCPVCSKGFRDNSHMIKHKRIHSSERPYKCKDCGKSFTQSYNLSVHKRTHLREKKLNCSVCHKVFENRTLLNLHRINEDHHDEVI